MCVCLLLKKEEEIECFLGKLLVIYFLECLTKGMDSYYGKDAKPFYFFGRKNSGFPFIIKFVQHPCVCMCSCVWRLGNSFCFLSFFIFAFEFVYCFTKRIKKKNKFAKNKEKE